MLLFCKWWRRSTNFLCVKMYFLFLPQQFLMSNKLETAMWLSRLFTVYCSIMFILPILGWVHSVTVFDKLEDCCSTLLSHSFPFFQPEEMSEYLWFLVFCRPYAAANFYQRALLANALTSALRLHQRLPRFQLSRVFLAQALQEDSCHYLLYSLILVNSYPITSILSPSNYGERINGSCCISS